MAYGYMLVFGAVFLNIIVSIEASHYCTSTLESISKPCGYCGVCRQLNSKSRSVCDGYYLKTAHTLFRNDFNTTCILRNHCKDNAKVCLKNSVRYTGVCYPLYGTYQCQCKPKFFGQECEHEEIALQRMFATENPPYALVSNIVYTPIFYSTDHAKVLISLLRKGLNLEIKLDNGRGEQLVFDEKKCDSNFKKISMLQFCKDLFNEFENIKICVGVIHGNRRFLRTGGCLIVLHIPYPIHINPESKQMIYKMMDGNISNSAVLGKVETMSITIFNRFVELQKTPIHKHTFDMINIYGPFSKECQTQVDILNCGKSMNSMPKFTLYKDIVFLGSVRLVDQELCFPLLSTWENEQSSSIDMFWKVWRVSTNHDELKDKPIDRYLKKDTYFVKNKSFYYGTYKIKVTANTIFQHDLIFGQAYCYFEIVKTPAQIIILGGSMRKIYYKENIKLEIITLLTPNQDENFRTLRVIYKWQCDDDSEIFCKPFHSSRTFRIISGPFKPLKVFNFTVGLKTVDSSSVITEQHAEHQIIEVTSDTRAILAIKCISNCGGSVFKTNPQEIIHLELMITESKSTLTYSKPLYKWLYMLDGSKETKEVDEFREKGKDLNVLLVKKNMLLDNQKYKFIVAAYNSNSHFAEMDIETCKLPKNVSCNIKPPRGVRGETFFNINCTYKENSEDFVSVSYEFYDRYLDEDGLGRLLGYSSTGILERVKLTRDKLYVRSTNIYGAFFESVLTVNLSSSSQNISVSNLEMGFYNFDNYIYRIGLLSACCDLVANLTIKVNVTNIILKHLAKESIDEETGAILLQNVLQNILYRLQSVTQVNQLEIHSITIIARILYRTSLILRSTLTHMYNRSRFLTTTQVMDFVRSILTCSNLVLGSVVNYNVFIYDIYINSKYSTYYIMGSLDNIQTMLAFKILPLNNQITIKLPEIIMLVIYANNIAENQISKMMCISESMKHFFKITPGHYFKIIWFKTNPFWWSNGDKINSDVSHIVLSYAVERIPDVNHTLNFVLNVTNLKHFIVNGLVKQADPKNSPEINDYVVAVHRLVPRKDSALFVKFIGITNDSTLRVIILQDQRPDYDYMMLNSQTVNRNSSKLKFQTSKDSLFLYIGILPGKEVPIGQAVNYSFEMYSATCNVWRYESWMTGRKCRVGYYTNIHRLLCSCSMSTSTLIIGGVLYIPANSLNPFSEISLFIAVVDNPFIVIIIFSTLTLYILLLLWTIKKHSEDKKQLSVIVLSDNNPKDNFPYLVAVFTGTRLFAGTTSNVGIRLFGEEGVSRAHILKTSKRPTLQSNSDDWFILFTPHHIGSLKNIRLWLDCSGNNPNWYCSKVFVCDMHKWETDTFFVERWFGITTKDIRVKLMEECATSKETNMFARLFFENIFNGFREHHLLASVFFRHPRSLVTRPEQLSIIFSGLLVIMLVSVLFYFSSKHPEDSPYYTIKKETVLVGVFTSIVGSLFCLIHSQLLRSCYKFVPSAPNVHAHDDSEHMYHFDRTFTIIEFPAWWRKFFISVTRFSKPCKMFPVQNEEETLVGVTINQNKRFVIWLLSIILITTFGNLIIVFSLHCGKIKMLLWATSVIIATIQSIVVTSPIKIIVKAFLFAITKVHHHQLLSHNIELQNIKDKLKSRDTVGYLEKLRIQRSSEIYKPPTNLRLYKLRKRQKTQLTIWALLYGCMCLLLLVITSSMITSMNLGDYFEASFDLCNDFNSNRVCEILHQTDYFNLEEVFGNIYEQYLPLLYSEKWYNKRNISLQGESFPSTGWLKYSSSRLVGFPQLRQIRVQRDLRCSIPTVMAHVTECFTVLTPETEDRENFSTGWAHDDWTDNLFDVSPWVFTDPSLTMGINVKTPSGYNCHGGGYIVPLRRTLIESKIILRNLNNTRWIDKYTRVVVFQFVTYNANKDIFTTALFITESKKVGIVVTSFYFGSIRLTKITVNGIILLIFFPICIFRILSMVNVMSVSNFIMDFWNMEEILIVVCYISAIVCYVQYLLEIETARENLQKYGLDQYFQLRSSTSHFENAQGLIGILLFLAGFRILRIAQFNNEIRLYINNLVAARYEIFTTWIAVVIGLIFFWRLVMFLLVEPPMFSLNEALVFTSDSQTVIHQYSSMLGKVLAYVLTLLCQLRTFSFTLSIHHYYKEGQTERKMQLYNRRRKQTHFLESTFD